MSRLLTPPFSDRSVALMLGIVPVVLFAPALAGGVFFQRDIHAYWQPQVETLVRVVAEGGFPFWDPYEGFGLPLLADPSHQVLYPPTWLNFVLLPPTVYKVLVFMHSWGAAVGLFLLARACGLPRLPAATAGAAWALSGPFLSTISLPHHFMGAAWIPWVLLALERLLQMPSLRLALILAGLATAQVLAGSGDMVVLTAMAAGARVLIHAWTARRVDPLLGLAAVLACGLSAAQWVPTLAAFSGTSRAAMASGTNLFWSVHPLALLELVVPRGFADLPLSDAMRAVLFESREPFFSSLYIGLVAVLVVSAWGFSKTGRHRLFLFASLAFLVAALGKHVPLVPLLAQLPVLSMFRYPVKAMVMASLFWALLLGVAVQHVVEPWTLQQRQRARVVGALAVALALFAFALSRAFVSHAEAWGGPLLAPPGWRVAAYAPLVDRLETAAVMCTLTGLLAGWRSVGELASPALPALLGLLAVADLAVAGSSVNPVAPPQLLSHVPPVVKVLAAETGAHRLYVPAPSSASVNRGLVRGPAGWKAEWSFALGLQEALQAPIGSRWGLFGSYDADFTGLAPITHSRLSAVMEQNRGSLRGLRLLQMAGVTEVLALDGRTPPELTEVARFSSVFAEPIRLLRVPDPVPFVSLVARSRHVTAGTAIDLLASGQADPAEFLVEDTADDEDGAGFAGSVRVITSRPDGLTVETVGNQPSHLRVAGSYAPGWRASVDGVSVPVVRANGLFRAVRVPAGTHVVVLTYRPAALAYGVALSLISLAGAAILSTRRKMAA